VEIARSAGIRYVYMGNMPGAGVDDTICPSCGKKVIDRSGYRIVARNLKSGRCSCGTLIPGVWH
jgi:pyruvate formate lyase activating enzyme